MTDPAYVFENNEGEYLPEKLLIVLKKLTKIKDQYKYTIAFYMHYKETLTHEQKYHIKLWINIFCIVANEPLKSVIL